MKDSLQTHRPIPPFHAVPMRTRREGWTPLKQAEFIGHLAQTGCVRTAARNLGMRRETAYRLRKRAGADSFNAAWDAALARGRGRECSPKKPLSPLHLPDRKVTLSQLAWRMETGIWRIRMRRGRYVGVTQKPDNSAVLALISRTNRLASGLA